MSSSSESLITRISLVSSLTSSPRFTASVASATISLTSSDSSAFSGFDLDTGCAFVAVALVDLDAFTAMIQSFPGQKIIPCQVVLHGQATIMTDFSGFCSRSSKTNLGRSLFLFKCQLSFCVFPEKHN